MNIQQLRYVVATADHRSMTAAAAAEFVAQPALSRAIRLLERELGLTLFERRGRGVALTATGEGFVARARGVLRSIDALRGVGAEHASAPALVIAATPLTQAMMALPLLAALPDRGGSLPARLLGCVDADDVHAAVTAGRAEIGICDQDIDSELVATGLGAREVRLISPPGLDLPDPLPVSALARVPLVLPAPGSDRRRALDWLFDHYGVQPPVAIETDERLVWFEAVRRGLASCLWPGFEALEVDPQTIRMRSFDPPMHQPFYAVHRPGDQPQPVTLMLDLMQRLTALHTAEDRSMVSAARHD